MKLFKKLSLAVPALAFSAFTTLSFALPPPPRPMVHSPEMENWHNEKECANFDILVNNQSQSQFPFKNQKWVEGQDQQEYSLKIYNNCNTKVLAIVSVDGLNVLSGDRAGYNGQGYVVGARGSVVIPGWRKSQSNTAAFYFTYPADSYAERVGKGSDVGVIGVAFFKEKIERPLPPPPPPIVYSAPAPSSSSISSMSPMSPSLQSQSAGQASESRESMSDSRAKDSSKAEKSLGTGYGRDIESNVRRVEFTKDSTTPFNVLQVRYETRSNLIRMGAYPKPVAPNLSNDRPNAFPQEQFVPPPPPRN